MTRLHHALRIAIALAATSLVIGNASNAQDKYERETKVRAAEVPDAASGWLRDAFGPVRGLKWYKEIYESGYSFEAKFKWRGRYHSVEFNPDGTLQDVEIETPLADLPPQVRENITRHLSETYRQHRITRLQVQYSGAPDALEHFFASGESTPLVVRYEIEYTATATDAPAHYREGLFDDTGSPLGSRRVVLPPTNNLLF